MLPFQVLSIGNWGKKWFSVIISYLLQYLCVGLLFYDFKITLAEQTHASRSNNLGSSRHLVNEPTHSRHLFMHCNHLVYYFCTDSSSQANPSGTGGMNFFCTTPVTYFSEMFEPFRILLENFCVLPLWQY